MTPNRRRQRRQSLDPRQDVNDGGFMKRPKTTRKHISTQTDQHPTRMINEMTQRRKIHEMTQSYSKKHQ